MRSTTRDSPTDNGEAMRDDEESGNEVEEEEPVSCSSFEIHYRNLRQTETGRSSDWAHPQEHGQPAVLQRCAIRLAEVQTVNVCLSSSIPRTDKLQQMIA